MAKTSGTGTMRRHLLKDHRDEWISSCLEQGIKLTCATSKVALDQYQACHGGARHPVLPDDVIPPFSNDVFLDALVDFVVCDDQVSLTFQHLYFYLIDNTHCCL